MNKKLYVRNIPFTAEEAQLQAHFSTGGLQVLSARIPKERETGRSRGFAFIEMVTPEDAQKAIETLNGREFMGRPLAVSEAREQERRPGAGAGGRPGAGGGGRSYGSPPPQTFEDPGMAGGGRGGRGGRDRDRGRDRNRDRDRDRRDRGGDDW